MYLQIISRKNTNISQFYSGYIVGQECNNHRKLFALWQNGEGRCVGIPQRCHLGSAFRQIARCRVRPPPPSGWLDEPGRLKGGGVPSPYSNSLKPTIIVTGILVTDRRFDLFQLKANRGDRIATRPKVL